MGGTLGHCLCTGLAVIGGRMIAQKISVRTGKIKTAKMLGSGSFSYDASSCGNYFCLSVSSVTIIGGIVFLAFAFSALFIKPDAGF